MNKQIDVVGAVALTKNTPKETFEFQYALSKSIPSSWRSILNEKGQIVWKFENTPAARFLGRRAARQLLSILIGTLARLVIWDYGIGLSLLIMSLLGMFKVVIR
jgi:hypothetical protein